MISVLPAYMISRYIPFTDLDVFKPLGPTDRTFVDSTCTNYPRYNVKITEHRIRKHEQLTVAYTVKLPRHLCSIHTKTCAAQVPLEEVYCYLSYGEVLYFFPPLLQYTKPLDSY
jgi:hypothetical protein